MGDFTNFGNVEFYERVFVTGLIASAVERRRGCDAMNASSSVTGYITFPPSFKKLGPPPSVLIRANV